MKTLIVSFVVACFALLPVSNVQAAPPGKSIEFAKRKFGQFSAGDTFKLKVKNVNIISTSGKIPRGIPKLRKNQLVEFTIGTRGELKGPGFSINFLNNDSVIHNYLDPASPYNLNSSARVTYAKPKPTAAVVTFNLVVISGPISELGSYQVAYTF